MKMLLPLVLVFCVALNIAAQEKKEGSGFFADLKGNMEYTKGHIVSLAEAVPEDKFIWRPAEGVRSISEVYMHIVGGNYFLASQLGMAMPEGFKQEMEKTVTKKR